MCSSLYLTLFLGRQPREVTPAKRQIPSLEKAVEPSIETNRSCGPGTNSDSQVANKTGSLRASEPWLFLFGFGRPTMLGRLGPSARRVECTH